MVCIFAFANADVCQNITMESHNLRTNIVKCYSNANILAQIKVRPIVDERYNFTNNINFIFWASDFYYMSGKIANMSLVNFKFEVVNHTTTQLFFEFSKHSNMTINIKTIPISIPPDEFFERTYSAGLKFDVLLKRNQTDECPKPKCLLLIVNRENEYYYNDLKYHLRINNSNSWRVSACASLYPGEEDVIPLNKSNFRVSSTSIIFEFVLACKSVYDTTCQTVFAEICSNEDLRIWNARQPNCTDGELNSDYYSLSPNNTGNIIVIAFVVCILVVALIYGIAKMIVKWKQNHRTDIEVPLTE